MEEFNVSETKSQISTANIARYLKSGSSAYFSLRKIIFGDIEKSYESESDGVVSMNTLGGVWQFILPSTFYDDTKDYNSTIVGDFLTELKTINCPSFNWLCTWLGSAKDNLNELLGMLYVPVFDLSKGAYSDEYIQFPQVEDISTWALLMEYVREVLNANNPNIVYVELSNFETSDGSATYEFPIPLYELMEDGSYSHTLTLNMRFLL